MGERYWRGDSTSSSSATSYREEKFDGNRGVTNRNDGIMRKGDPGYDDYMARAQKTHEEFMKEWRAKNDVPEEKSSLDSPKL